MRIRQSVCLSLLSLIWIPAVLFGQSGRAGWFQKARWGVFMHYLAERADLPTEEWNQRIHQIDVEGLARQLESAGAGYFFITLGQNSGHYLSPNKTYDRLTGIQSSKCSRRDLVEDLYQALHPRGIALMVYLPAGAPDEDQVAMEKLEWKKGPQRNLNFQRKWEEVIREWSTRWGTKVAGWWFDGCYWPNSMYRFPEPPNFSSFSAAARSGNPASIVAFNRGVVVPIHPESEQEDFTAGEINEADLVRFDAWWVDGAQFHMLSYLGQQWSNGAPRYPTEKVVEITRRIVEKGGVVSWDVPHEKNGLIQAPFLRQLQAVGKAMRK
jgi:alpha-L-fucosidase